MVLLNLVENASVVYPKNIRPERKKKSFSYKTKLNNEHSFKKIKVYFATIIISRECLVQKKYIQK